MDKFLTKISHLVTVYSKNIIIVSLFISICFGSGLAFLGLDANPFSYFKKDNPIKIADNTLNKNFGGSQQFSILFQGDIKDPKILNKMDYYVSELKNIKQVGDVTSISEMIKEMSKALNKLEDPLYDKIPKTREAVAQYLEMYMMSGDPDDFESLVNYEYDTGIITTMMHTISTTEVVKIADEIDNFLNTKISDLDIEVSGLMIFLKDFVDLVVQSSITSIFVSIGVILVIVWIFFKSW